MFKGSQRSWALALAISPALWVLSGDRAAMAHPSGDPSCYLPPFSETLSPCVPHDVPFGSADIADLATFAWQEFVALNWVAMDPGTTGIRGRPAPDTDPKTGFLDVAPDANGNYPLVVWQSYRHKNEMFPADGKTDPTFDSNMPRYSYSTQPTPATGGAPPSFTLFNNLDETSQISLDNMYAHSTSTPPEKNPQSGIRVAFEAKVNRAVFQYMVDNGYTSPGADGSYSNLMNALQATNPTPIPPSNKPNPKYIPGSVGTCTPPAGVSVSQIILLPCGTIAVAGDAGEGAIETKAAWRALTDEEAKSGRFFTRNVIYYTGGGTGQPPQTYHNAVWGLVALHIIHKTKSFPAFVFASFEQVDNYDDTNPANPNPENLAFLNTGSTASFPEIPVRRAHAINSAIVPVTEAVHAAFTDPTTGNPDTVWQYYELIGVQATPVDGPPPPSATADELSYYFMANIMVETNQVLQNFRGSVDATKAALQTPPVAYPKVDNVYVNGAPGSPYQMGGCQGCHGFQGQIVGGDMSVLIATAPYDTLFADSLDAAPITTVATYHKRRFGVEQRTGLKFSQKPSKRPGDKP